jgi:multisubunit Na+/H+ antiporter MnhC subunit
MPSTSTLAKERRRRKSITVLWLAILTAITIFLLYKEMIALLYILATLGVTVLLTVVGMADLSQGEPSSFDSERIDDSAAIGSGIASVAGNKKA